MSLYCRFPKEHRWMAVKRKGHYVTYSSHKHVLLNCKDCPAWEIAGIEEARARCGLSEEELPSTPKVTRAKSKRKIP